jgi:signal transduction histidine kinase
MWTRSAPQLRNPLHAMMGAVSMLESGDAPPDEARWQVQALRHGVDVMHELTSDFLDIHALSAGKLKLAEGWTDIRALLSQ